MFPLGDASRRLLHWPIITLGLMAIHGVVFVLELMGSGSFIAQWSLVPSHIIAGDDWITLLTSMFLHRGWLDLLANMIFLWAFAPQVEDLLGAVPFLCFYLLGGLAASMTGIIVTPAAEVAYLGASGAVAALLGAFLSAYPQDRIRALVLSVRLSRVALIPAVYLVGVWFLVQVFDQVGSVVTVPVASGGALYLTLVGGFVFGLVAARLFETKRQRAEHGLSL